MPINTSLNKTQRYSRHTYGDDGLWGKRNILSVSFVACDLRKAALAGTTQVQAATAMSNTVASTYTSFLLQPDVPRNLVITIGGTAANVPTGNIVVTGKNVEGATITENFALTLDTLTTITGVKAFKSITSIAAPLADGTGVTVAVGFGAKLGIGLRNIASMPIKVLVRAATGNPPTETLEDPAASNFSATLVENNTVTTTTAQDGAKEFRVYVLNYKWAVNPTNAQPDYGV